MGIVNILIHLYDPMTGQAVWDIGTITLDSYTPDPLTSNGGNYYFNRIPYYGTYTLTVNIPGYQGVSQSITPYVDDPNTTQEFDIPLVSGNGCVPNWQCEQPLNGYEADGCGARRINPACNLGTQPPGSSNSLLYIGMAVIVAIVIMKD